MTREVVFEKLNEIFQENFDDPDIQVTEETVADDIEGWDSLEHINLIASIESAFNIKFSMSEALKLQKVGDMVDIIIQKAE